MSKFIAYYRVSTTGQGQSGLGLEAQRTVVLNYAKDDRIIAEFTEIESGKNNRRPKLTKAIELAKSENATLLIANLTRVSRNIAFIFSLKEAGIKFIACNMPYADTMQFAFSAGQAQQEAEIISERTKAALSELKKRGIKLGSDTFVKPEVQQKAFKASLATRQNEARENENNIRAYSLIKSLLLNGLNLSKITAELNKNGFRTSKGNEFQIVQVQRVVNLYKKGLPND